MRIVDRFEVKGSVQIPLFQGVNAMGRLLTFRRGLITSAVIMRYVPLVGMMNTNNVLIGIDQVDAELSLDGALPNVLGTAACQARTVVIPLSMFERDGYDKKSGMYLHMVSPDPGTVGYVDVCYTLIGVNPGLRNVSDELLIFGYTKIGALIGESATDGGYHEFPDGEDAEVDCDVGEYIYVATKKTVSDLVAGSLQWVSDNWAIVVQATKLAFHIANAVGMFAMRFKPLLGVDARARSRVPFVFPYGVRLASNSLPIQAGRESHGTPPSVETNPQTRLLRKFGDGSRTAR